MKYLLAVFIMLLACNGIFGQHTIRLSIKDSEDKQPLASATAIITAWNKTSVADSTGLVTFENIPEGTYAITVSYVGLEEQKVTVQVPQPGGMVLVFLEQAEEHEEEVIVTTTRISRTI